MKRLNLKYLFEEIFSLFFLVEFLSLKNQTNYHLLEKKGRNLLLIKVNGIEKKF